MDGFSLFSCETVDNRGFNLPAVPAGETDENGVPIGNDFTSDVRVRRAINLAIDRQAMIDHVLNGHGTIAYSVCDKMPWYSKDSEAAFDPQEAERLLDEAGWKTGADGIRERMERRLDSQCFTPQEIRSARPFQRIRPTSWQRLGSM